jgi:putative toxin-antitoxin system antitoxin component (TIGR02293 family)
LLTSVLVAIYKTSNGVDAARANINLNCTATRAKLHQKSKRRKLGPMTKAQLLEAPRPYPGIKQAKIATARAHAVVISSAMVQISLIREGAPAETFAQTAKNIGLAQAELAKKLGLSPRTMASRRTRLTSEETEKTLRAQYLFEQAVAVFGSEEEARRWLTNPAYGLEDQRPIDLLDTEPGAMQVRDYLGAIECGNYW